MENIINPRNELTTPAKRNLPRDVFLHLLAMVTLYWSAISFITLCHQTLNYIFPDVLDYGHLEVTGAMRFAVSSLIIVFPIFILVSWFLNKIYKKESQVRDSKIRKWLIYLTLFVASLVIIGDLIFIINTFLNGEVTVRFILKALSIIVVAGVIFGYYLDDVRRAVSSNSTKYFAWASCVAVVAMIIGSFFIIGSPKSASLDKIDQQRVNDLQSIQWQIVNYWQRKGELPKTLNDLNDSISGYIVSTDPETREPYEYTPSLDSNESGEVGLSFSICAVFSLDNFNEASVPIMGKTPISEVNENWQHKQGKYCFLRIIDQQLYPPSNKRK